MSYLQAIIMGIVQGTAEFLPISSSGHLAIFEKLFHMNEPDITFDIILHIGTLAAVFIVYYHDIKKMVVEGVRLTCDFLLNIFIFFQNNIGKKELTYHKVINSAYRKFVMLVIVSTIPTGVIGYLAKDIIEEVKTNLFIVGVCLLITACLLIISDKAGEGSKRPKNITYSNAFGIGICQGIATLPGISRSGATITACLISGFDRRFAVKYSFIMSIPAILGASILDLMDLVKEGSSGIPLGQYLVGMVVAGFAGLFCMKTLMILIKNKKFKYFAYYCVAAGVLAIVLNFVI